jgi:hypothetical protein
VGQSFSPAIPDEKVMDFIEFGMALVHKTGQKWRERVIWVYVETQKYTITPKVIIPCSELV